MTSPPSGTFPKKHPFLHRRSPLIQIIKTRFPLSPYNMLGCVAPHLEPTTKPPVGIFDVDSTCFICLITPMMSINSSLVQLGVNLANWLMMQKLQQQQSGLPVQIVVGFGLDSRNRYFDPTHENVAVASLTSHLHVFPLPNCQILINQGSAQYICKKNAFTHPLNYKDFYTTTKSAALSSIFSRACQA